MRTETINKQQQSPRKTADDNSLIQAKDSRFETRNFFAISKPPKYLYNGVEGAGLNNAVTFNLTLGSAEVGNKMVICGQQKKKNYTV